MSPRVSSPGDTHEVYPLLVMIILLQGEIASNGL